MTTIHTPPPVRPSRRPAIEVAPQVACMPLSIVNLYFVSASSAVGAEWVMIDAGLAISAVRILKAARGRFGDVPPAAIVLTHAHFDHVGALPWLAEYWDVPVYAHSMELPYLVGRSAYPAPDPTVGGGAMAYFSFLYPRRPLHMEHRARALPANGSVPGLPDWRWIHTPGHTPGHVSFFRENDRTLIAGDAIVTTRQESLRGALFQPQQVWRPPAYFTSDWIDAARSVRRLAELEPQVVAAGHGQPMHGQAMRDQLHKLADRFEQIARPRHGRYVHAPAIADSAGVAYVPPAMQPTTVVAFAGAGLLGGAAAGWWLWRRRSRRCDVDR